MKWIHGIQKQRDGYAYAGPDCPLVRERVVTPSGRVIYRTYRACD